MGAGPRLCRLIAAADPPPIPSRGSGRDDRSAETKRGGHHRVRFEREAHHQQGGICNTANQIYVKTVDFLSRLSARYSRLIAADTAHLAGQVMDRAEQANKIFPSDTQRKELRKAHHLEALAALSALDVRLTHCYEILYCNPQGAFTDSKGKSVPPKEAAERLDRMAQELGELIDQEETLLRNIMESDKKRK